MLPGPPMMYGTTFIGQFVMNGYGSLPAGRGSSKQPACVVGLSLKPRLHVPRSPSISSWFGRFCDAGSIESEVNCSRCQPTTASISVLLSLSLLVHLPDTSVTSVAVFVPW